VRASRCAAANLTEVAALYGEDSIMVVDGVSVVGVAAIGSLIMPRVRARAPAAKAAARRHRFARTCPPAQFDSGPVHVKWLSVDGQFTAANHLLILTTGDSTVPASRFTEFFHLVHNGTNWYIKTQVLRFGPGSTPFNLAADASGTGAAFAADYYKLYAADRMRCVTTLPRRGAAGPVTTAPTASPLVAAAWGPCTGT